MPNHGSEEMDDDRVQRDFAKAAGLGSTGHFPEGKLSPEDEGEITFAVTEKNGKVVLNFGKPIFWMGLSPTLARRLSKLLRKTANKAEGAK